jgi:hypothetical protein
MRIAADAGVAAAAVATASAVAASIPASLCLMSLRIAISSWTGTPEVGFRAFRPLLQNSIRAGLRKKGEAK